MNRQPEWVAYNHRDELVRALAQIDELKAVVEAAEHYVHHCEAAHHGPCTHLKKRAHKNLIDEVHAYQESRQ